MFYFLIDIIVGIAAGFIAGLLGTGNSLVVLPALILLFPTYGIPLDMALPLAVGTNLAICGVSILFAAISHNKHSKMDWNIFYVTGPAYFIGSLIGPWIAYLLPVHILKTYIAIFIFFAAFTLLLKEKSHKLDYLPSQKNLFISSFIVSLLSSISGMASGVLIVPYLTWLGVDIKKAISIALPGAVVFSFTAMVGYMITGWGIPSLPSYSLGYIYLPTTIVISIAAALCTQYGVKLHHQLDISKLKKLFALLLFIAGIATLRA